MPGPEPGQPGQRIQITLPETYGKTDESVWEELERFLYQGFLTATTHVAGKSFVFKSLNFHELRNIDFMRPSRGAAADARDAYRNAMIAHSVFMVDGVNALHDRPRNVHRLAKTVGKLPVAVRDKILENLAALNERAVRLYPLVESYAHESRSRFRWLQVGGVPVHSPMATGIPGTDCLGMSTSQALWTALNRMLDRREEMESQWSNAKFIGSCFSGKGVRAIDERDRARSERERVEREERKIEVLHDYLNRSVGKASKDQVIDLPDGRKAVVVRSGTQDGRWRADSAEELRDQLSSALNGEKDYHDLVIEAKERELMERARVLDGERTRMFGAPAAAVEGSPVAGGGSMILGGREAHDAYVARIQAMRESQIRRASREDMGREAQQSSDGPDGGGGPDRG